MYCFPVKQKTLREDATRCMRNMTAMGSLHLARKAEQVPQGLRDLGSSKGTCPLCSFTKDLGRKEIRKAEKEISCVLGNRFGKWHK